MRTVKIGTMTAVPLNVQPYAIIRIFIKNAHEIMEGNREAQIKDRAVIVEGNRVFQVTKGGQIARPKAQLTLCTKLKAEPSLCRKIKHLKPPKVSKYQDQKPSRRKWRRIGYPMWSHRESKGQVVILEKLRPSKKAMPKAKLSLQRKTKMLSNRRKPRSEEEGRGVIAEKHDQATNCHCEGKPRIVSHQRWVNSEAEG